MRLRGACQGARAVPRAGDARRRAAVHAARRAPGRAQAGRRGAGGARATELGQEQRLVVLGARRACTLQLRVSGANIEHRTSHPLLPFLPPLALRLTWRRTDMPREDTASVDHPHPRSASLREQTARSLRQSARSLTRSPLLRQPARSLTRSPLLRQSARGLTRPPVGLQVGSFSEKTRGSRGRKLSMLPEGQERSALGVPRARSAGASPRHSPMAINVSCMSHFVSTRTISEPSHGALMPQPIAGVGHGV